MRHFVFFRAILSFLKAYVIDSIGCDFYNKNKQEINIRRTAAEAQNFAHFLPISEPKLCTQIRCDCVAFFWGGIAAEQTHPFRLPQPLPQPNRFGSARKP